MLRGGELKGCDGVGLEGWRVRGDRQRGPLGVNLHEADNRTRNIKAIGHQVNPIKCRVNA